MFSGGAIGGFNERILNVIRSKGPSLPIQIAKAVNLQPLFAAAFLAELSSEQKLKISHLKVGSSPLYYVPGQEMMLEGFIEYLNQREREAFHHLKKNGILDDEIQSPVVRVALRAIVDFAIPLRVRVGGDTKIFWKFFGLSDEDAMGKVEKSIAGSQPTPETKTIEPQLSPIGQTVSASTPIVQVPQTLVQNLPPVISSNETAIETRQEKEENKVVEIYIPEKKNEESQKLPLEELIVEKEKGKNDTEEVKREDIGESAIDDRTAKKKKPKKPLLQQEEKIGEEVVIQKTLPVKEEPDYEFPRKLKEQLSENQIELLEVILAKKKDFVGKVKTKAHFGGHEYYLIAKDKKNVSDDDLAVALQKAQSEKMLALFMAPGVLTKKAQAYLQEWRNLVKFEQIN